MTTDPLELSKKRPDLSAVVPVTMSQKVCITVAFLVFMTLLIIFPWATAKTFILLSTLFYLFVSIYKFVLIGLSVGHSSEIRISDDDLAGVSDDDLPIYSILVPMYDEPESARQMVKALSELDYPDDKKDVQFLLEEDDAVTRDAVAAIDLPPFIRATVVPESHPRTKPKACNIGLGVAKGKYLVIYDAEDRPERDQLKKAVLAFSRVDKDIVCLQSKLNFYNPRQNLLTRWFTAEYSAWYDLSLPGLSAIAAVIPLGGTSNHFITDKLQELLGWDAYNVTEDCDLGVRISRAGYGTRVLDTTTWEEACGSLRFWVCQRTRWIKGYMQTYFVHMRNPFTLLRDLGLKNFFHFQIIIGGLVFAFLINPLFWGLTTLWFVLRLDVLSNLFPGMVFVMGAICLFAGNFVFVYIGAIGCYRRKYFDLVKYALLAPAYWVMMSYAGWRAFAQFFSNPFKWEKTKHGLFEGSHSMPAEEEAV
jgi:cellulose synthase/poly-beta-1,6-N-acetylglucosamine synthase-like glycosyltransferase